MNDTAENNIKHDVIIKSRNKMEITGVSDVTSFDDGTIVAQIGDIGISIEGENLKIEKFNAESGEFILNGTITGFFYFNHSPQKKKKFMGDIFK